MEVKEELGYGWWGKRDFEIVVECEASEFTENERNLIIKKLVPLMVGSKQAAKEEKQKKGNKGGGLEGEIPGNALPNSSIFCGTRTSRQSPPSTTRSRLSVCGPNSTRISQMPCTRRRLKQRLQSRADYSNSLQAVLCDCGGMYGWNSDFNPNKVP